MNYAYVSAWNDLMFVYNDMEQAVADAYQFNYDSWSANQMRQNAIWGYINSHEKGGKAKADLRCVLR